MLYKLLAQYKTRKLSRGISREVLEAEWKEKKKTNLISCLVLCWPSTVWIYPASDNSWQELHFIIASQYIRIQAGAAPGSPISRQPWHKRKPAEESFHTMFYIQIGRIPNGDLSFNSKKQMNQCWFITSRQKNGWVWHRIRAQWLRLQGTSGDHLVPLPTQAGAATAGCPGLHPVRVWVPPSMEKLQPLWATCPRVWSGNLSSWESATSGLCQTPLGVQLRRAFQGTLWHTAKLGLSPV